MSLALATWIGAIATVVLAAGAIITAIFAIRAFGKQTQELGVLERQARDQADLLRVQSDQLDAQHDQFREQRKVNEKQTEVLALQAKELSESLDERKHQADEQRREQANRVAAWFAPGEVPASGTGSGPAWGAIIRNNSDLPILSVRVFFHFIAADSTASETWQRRALVLLGYVRVRRAAGRRAP